MLVVEHAGYKHHDGGDGLVLVMMDSYGDDSSYGDDG